MNTKYLLTTMFLPYVRSLSMQNKYINNSIRNIRKFGALRISNYNNNKYNNKYNKYHVKKIYKMNNSPVPINDNDDFLEKQKLKLLKIYKNKITHMTHNTNSCIFCKGEGFVQCEMCKQTGCLGCYKCEYTGFEKCSFCDGSGNSRIIL